MSYKADNAFKLSNTTYYFIINLVNAVEDGHLYLNFTTDWQIFEKNCTVISGVIKKSDGTDIRCYLLSDYNSYMIDNFQRIDDTLQIIVKTLL